MKKSYTNMPTAMDKLHVVFTDKQKDKLNKFFNETHDDTYTGVIGGRYTYSFTPTSLGIIIKVSDSVTKTEVDLTDYDLW